MGNARHGNTNQEEAKACTLILEKRLRSKASRDNRASYNDELSIVGNYSTKTITDCRHWPDIIVNIIKANWILYTSSEYLEPEINMERCLQQYYTQPSPCEILFPVGSDIQGPLPSKILTCVLALWRKQPRSFYYNVMWWCLDSLLVIVANLAWRSSCLAYKLWSTLGVYTQQRP